VIVYDNIDRGIIPQIFFRRHLIFWVWHACVWINKMLCDLAICFPTIGDQWIIDPRAMYFRMNGNICASRDSIDTTNIFFMLRVIPPKSYPLTSRSQWYCRCPNFALSISTIIPFPSIWLWLFVNHWFMSWEARLL